MKSLKESLLDDEDVLVDKTSIKNLIIEWLEKYDIKNYKINDDYTIDVDANIDLYEYSESQLPDYIQFNKMNGWFDISYSKIENLKGCPKIIKGNFDCNDCINLKTLEGAPKIVKGNFDCADCKNLKTLEGAPEIVYGSFYCSYCDKLESLKGAPKKVGRNFYCEFCRSLESLKGAPKNCKIYSKNCPKLK